MRNNFCVSPDIIKIAIFCLLLSCNINAEETKKLEVIGADVSSLTSLLNSGVTFKDADGNSADLLKILADNGVNHIRLRVWNDPFDASGNGYGGGNCNLANAVTIGKQAASYGMKVLVDFHYSDFWADPSKQNAPKEWRDFTLEQKMTAIKQFTTESLQTLIDAGVQVDMVQIGNEINNGMCGERSWPKKASLLKVASASVREFAGVLVVVHFTNPEQESNFTNIAKQLAANGVDYDIFGTSYYPFWHGTLDSLKKVLKSIKKNYNKDVMIAEYSYPYTLNDSDYCGNNINTDTDKSSLPYEVSVKGQTRAIKDIIAAMTEIGAVGAFYWEPAWIAVGTNSWADNHIIWEKYGSGWASSFSAEYDKDVSQYGAGGSSWDNQALFDPTGKVLDSIKAFRQ